ncbi:MAG: deazaflavin-dependent oxidoreductase (nitroreductase family) [Hyphomicrobiaceae bacterium]|jgi:deazaflavin-dependent oxidoreductase (nitroreductase family)
MSAFQILLKVHQWLYETTDGFIGHSLFGTPTLLLRTNGRRSGETRTSALLYLKNGEGWVVVASKGGSPTAPAWLHNLRANPEVEVQIGRKRTAVVASEIPQDDPRHAGLWKSFNDANDGRFDRYQASTTRPIPLVALQPKES